MPALAEVHRRLHATARLIFPPLVSDLMGLERRTDDEHIAHIRLHEADKPKADVLWSLLLLLYLLVFATAVGMHSYVIHHLKSSAKCLHMRVTNLNVAGLCLLFLPVWSMTLGPLVSVAVAAYGIHVVQQTAPIITCAAA